MLVLFLMLGSVFFVLIIVFFLLVREFGLNLIWIKVMFWLKVFGLFCLVRM